jgi:hypothetical protein
MSGPYVAFRVNRTTRGILTDTIGYEPDPMVAVFTNPFEWLVVCDSADKVVVRALEDGKRTLAVIAMATLRNDKLEERRQLDPDVPPRSMWAWLEEVVFIQRERGFVNRRPDAFDHAELSDAAPPPESPEAVWQQAAGMIAKTRIPPPPAPRPPPPPVVPPSPTLWSTPPAEAPLKPTEHARYVEMVFDHADVAVVAGGVRYAPDPSLRPSGRYQMKLACNAQGQVSIAAPGDGELAVIALAIWRDSALCDRQQQGGEPDDFQWIALEDALRGELSCAP